MSKEVTKITKEELDKVQGFTKVSNDIVYQIGVILPSFKSMFTSP